MQRREFITLLGGVAACHVPGAKVLAQSRALRLGTFRRRIRAVHRFWMAFDRRMRKMGHVEGENYVFDFVNVSGRFERFDEETRGLVDRNVDIILAPGAEQQLNSALAANDSIPIVIVAGDYDPLKNGYVTNSGRPGGRVIGLVRSVSRPEGL